MLVVSSYLPAPTWGSKARSYYLLKALASKHEVSLLAVVDQVSAREYQQADTHVLNGLTRNVTLVTRPVQRSKRWLQLSNLVLGKASTLAPYTIRTLQVTIDGLLERERYDAVFFDSVLMAGLRLPEQVKMIIGQHNIEYEILQRTYQHERAWPRKFYNWREYHLVKPFELACCARADVVFVTSERERLLLEQLIPHCLVGVVPNGVDLATFRSSVIEQEGEKPDHIIFTGSMDYYPNVDAVLFFARECWPYLRSQRPDIRWQIVGRNPPPEVQQLANLPGVTVTGSVPDTRPYFAAAAVAIVPLQIGGGTRLKILEALAMRKAVVSTSLGAEGLQVVAGKHLCIEDAALPFAQTVLRLLQEREQRRALGNAGRLLVEAEYSWEHCGEQMLAVLERLAPVEGARR